MRRQGTRSSPCKSHLNDQKQHSCGCRLQETLRKQEEDMYRWSLNSCPSPGLVRKDQAHNKVFSSPGAVGQKPTCCTQSRGFFLLLLPYQAAINQQPKMWLGTLISNKKYPLIQRLAEEPKQPQAFSSMAPSSWVSEALVSQVEAVKLCVNKTNQDSHSLNILLKKWTPYRDRMNKAFMHPF